ncbi:proline-rich protein 36-like [Scyliorhinus canicula]|uniref:proline-rich protein 36-like n=1 Tax=Scyliorhinus canicula TaxID=7830 RepID=UPI0018F5C738|nr:proline-rich protein 36-like [Scyliorhinus canicula]
MGNTHSEAPVQRERDPSAQNAEVLRKDREDEKASRKPNPPGREEQQRASFSTAYSSASVAEPQRARDTNPQTGVQGNPEPANPTILDTSVKPSQGKKRKIAKARKWTSVQANSQDALAIVDKLTSDRLHSSMRAEQGSLPKATEGLASVLDFCHHEKELKRQAGPNTGNKDLLSQGAASRCAEPDTDIGTTPQRGGQGEPLDSTLHSLLPSNQSATAARRLQLTYSPQGCQGKPGPTQGQSSQAPVNGKELPNKLIKLSIIRSPPCPQVTSPGASDKARPPAFQHDDQGRPQPAKAPAPRPTMKPAHADGKHSGWGAEEGAPPSEATEPAAGESPGRQAAPTCQVNRGGALPEAALASAKNGNLPPSVPSGRLKAQSFLNKWGAHVEKDPSSAEKSQPLVDLPPFPPGAKAMAPHQEKYGAPAGISYAEALKQVPLMRISQDARCPANEAKEEAEALDPNGTKELGDVAPTQDSGSAAMKKKLPFYEQLIASLKSQTQKQKGLKPLRQTLTQEELSQSKPGKNGGTLEAPAVLRVSPEPLLLPGSQTQTPAGSPQPPQLPSPASFQFEAPDHSARTKADPKFVQWFQQQQQQPIFQFQSKLGPRPGPQEQAGAAASLSLGPVFQAASDPQLPVPGCGTVPQHHTSVQLPSQSWLNQQIEAQCRLQLHPQAQPWPVSMDSPPSLYASPQHNSQPARSSLASDQLPIWPRLQGQMTHLPYQQHPKPAIQTSLHLQISCNLQQQLAVAPPPPLPVPAKLEPPQQPKQLQLQNRNQSPTQGPAAPKAEPKGGPKPAAPPKMATKPPKQEQLPPRASHQTSAKPKAQAQAKGRKGQPALPSQPLPAQRQEPIKVQAAAEPAAEGLSPLQRPTGRWSAFQIDKTCTRKCHCRHREDKGTSHLPRNIANWTNSVKEPFSETPWVRTAVLAGSLVAGTKFCMDHFKANNDPG